MKPLVVMVCLFPLTVFAKKQDMGQVTSATLYSSYVNRGKQDGLENGQVLTLLRKGRKIGTCKVSLIAEHFAKCEGGGGRVSDEFAFERRGKSEEAPPPSVLAPKEIQRRLSELHRTETELREFDQKASVVGRVSRRPGVFLSHVFFSGASGGPFSFQRVDAQAYDVSLGAGFRLSFDLTAMHQSERPSDTRNALTKSDVLLVRRLEVGFRKNEFPLAASLGRTWLMATSGMLPIDGAQALWRAENGEGGVFAGFLPRANDLSWVSNQWALGSFWQSRFFAGKGKESTMAQVGLRGNWAMREGLGDRFEAAFTGMLWMKDFLDVSTSLEMGAGKSQAPYAVDAASLMVGFGRFDSARIQGQIRYRGLPLNGLTELGMLSSAQRALHADISLAVPLFSLFRLGLWGGTAVDALSQLRQIYLGPEWVVPRFGDLPLSLRLAHTEEWGWLRGRMTLAQLAYAPWGQWRVIGRANWLQQDASGGEVGMIESQWGASTAVEVTLWTHFWARAMWASRFPIAALSSMPNSTWDVQIGGMW